MRTIKFRAWDLRTNPGGWREIDKYERMAILESHDFVIEQFTGLHDKNGRDIYEGDILKSPHGQVLDPVRWCRDGAGFYPLSCDEAYAMAGMMADRYEVIGNIHENPELLKSTPPLLAGEGEGKS